MYFFFPPLSLSSTTLLSPAPPPGQLLVPGAWCGLDLPSFLPLALSPCSEWPYAGRWQSVAPFALLVGALTTAG